MRHRKKGKTLGRTKGPREALIANLATSLILYEAVTTTATKAKAVRPVVERLITKGKVRSLHSKHELDKVLLDSRAVRKVLEVLGPRYRERQGGYLRIVKLGQRRGDAAQLAKIEFV